MKKHILESLSFAVLGGLYAFAATAATSLFSDYGQIQNVQKYSSNPFWTPNSPYNQRLPQPVYVQGADLNTEDCIKVVQSKVAVQCMARDNCKNTTLAEIRPTIMVELSNLPGNNYVSACAGYIDGIFESYVQQYGNSMPNRAVNFPKATDANPSINNNSGVQIQNPYKQTTPQWQKDIQERRNELTALQRENGAGSEHLEHNEFPATFNDLSFAARSEFMADDIEQYKNLQTYNELKAQDIATWCSGDGSGSKMCNEYAKEHTAAVSSVVDSDNIVHDNDIINNTVGENDDVYYDLRIYSDGKYWSSIYQQKTTRDKNLCYAVCGFHVEEDDVNQKVLMPVLGQSYCVPQVNTVAWDTDNFILRSTETAENIKITKEQIPDIISKLKSIADTGHCDWSKQDIMAVIFIHNKKTGSSQKYLEIKLDD